MTPSTCWSRLVRALSVAVTALFVLPAETSVACPFCDAPSLTLAEMVDQSDVVLLVEWSGGTEPDGESAGETEYAVVRALGSGTRAFEKGDTVSLPRYRPGEQGELSLLTAIDERGLEWDPPTAVDEVIVRYIEMAPAREQPITERLAYYLTHLESPEQAIANDAYAEFANSPYDEIVKVRKEFQRERLRRWIESDETPPNRIALYGLLLGLCGIAEDARFLQGRVLEPTTEFRLGIEGIMSGYVLLTGEPGLRRIEQSKFEAEALVDEDGNPVLDPEGRPLPVPVSEVYSAMQVLRFLHRYEEELVGSDRLHQSMRLLLDHPGLADSAIADLARWKDWSVIDRLVNLYGTTGFEVGAAKRAIIGYLVAATRDVPKEPDVAPGEHVDEANAALESLRERDRETVDQALRFLQPLVRPE